MLKKDSEFTDAEKIDYIFTKMRKQAKIGAVMNGLKFLFFGGIAYFYIFIAPNLDIDKLAEKYVIPKMSKIVEETAEKTMQNVGGASIGDQIDPQLQEMISGVEASDQAQSGSTIRKRLNIPKISKEKTQEIMEILGE